MEELEISQKFKDYFELNMEQILRYKHKGRKWVKINYEDILLFDCDLAEDLLNEPEEVINIGEAVLNELDLPNYMKLRIFNLPPNQEKQIWQVRGTDVGPFISLIGIINKIGDVYHECASIKFECPQCGNILNILQEEGKELKSPTKCGCGRKGKLRALKKELYDVIKIGIIDDLMDESNQNRMVAKEKLAILSKDLTDELIDKELKVGRKVKLSGYFKYMQVKNSTEFKSIFYINYIEFVEVGWDIVELTTEDEKEFEKLSQDENLLQDMADSIADVEGCEQAKMACLLLLVGAPHLYDLNNHLQSRGTIHILLIGNPGVAKTYIAKRAGSISPINSFQSAATASGKGLVASVNQDKDLGMWVAYPGVVPMSHKGVVVIDEIDKTNPEDYGDHNNAMNDMMVPIAKSNVKAKLATETSYLATANPENRVFVNEISFYDQINMPKDFLDRFDIIFPLITSQDKIKRDKIMDIMIGRHLDDKEDAVWQPKYNHNTIMKYVAYCRRKKPKPVLSKSLSPLIKSQLHELMNPKGDNQERVSFRQLESLLRFAYASARLNLRDIEEEDILFSFELKKKSFSDLGIIDESGNFNWAKLENVDIKKIKVEDQIKNIMNMMFEEKGKEIDMQEVIMNCSKENMEEEDFDKYFAREKQKGNFFEPRRGKISKL